MGTKDYNAIYSFKEGKTGVSVAASKYEQDYYKYRDVKSDKTKRWPGKSDFKNEKVSLEIEQELENGSNISLGYDYSKFDGFSPTQATDWYPDLQGILDKKTENVYAKYDWTLNEKDVGYLQIYHNKLEYNNAGAMEEKTKGIDIQQAISTSEHNKLVIGGSWRKSDVKSTYLDFATNTIKFNYDDDIENFAFFINDTLEFAPTWSLNTGMRYDDHSVAGNETTLSAGLNKKFDEDSHFYINWGQVFKAPTTDDLYYHSEMYGSVRKGNPNLKAETGDIWTIGYSTKIKERTQLEINCFESKLDDAIDWVYDEYWNAEAKNVDKQKKRGAELTINHKLNDNVDLTASYTYIRVKNNEGNGYERDWNYMPNTYRFGVNYHDGKWISNIWLRAGSGCDTAHAGYNVGYVESSFATVDMSITYKATEDLSFYAKGYNLFNEAYAEQAGVSSGSYMYPAQSRRFIVGAEYKF